MCCDEKEEKKRFANLDVVNLTHIKKNFGILKNYIYVDVCAYICLWVPVKDRRGFLITWNRRHRCLRTVRYDSWEWTLVRLQGQ